MPVCSRVVKFGTCGEMKVRTVKNWKLKRRQCFTVAALILVIKQIEYLVGKWWPRCSMSGLPLGKQAEMDRGKILSWDPASESAF